MKNRNKFQWSDPYVEQLISLWAAGKSGTEIAQEIGNGLTRCAVLGKVCRLALPKRDERPRRRKTTKAKRQVTYYIPQFLNLPRIKPEPFVPVVVEEPPLVCRPCSLQDLNADTCRWPIGHPSDADFYFCGASPVQDRPYCLHHMKIAYEPEKPKTRRRKARSGRLVAADEMRAA